MPSTTSLYGLSRLGFFNGDNAVGRDLFHRVGDEVADLLTCRGNSCDTVRCPSVPETFLAFFSIASTAVSVAF